MFVDIENLKSVLAVENLLIPYKRGKLSLDKKSYLPKEPITPEVCFEVLKSTNAPRNIKDMLACIADLSLSEQALFKEVVLATFSNREQPEPIFNLGKQLACDNNCINDFVKRTEFLEGDFFLSSPNLSRGLMTPDEHLSNMDFSNYDKLVCLNETHVSLAQAINLPHVIDLSRCDKVEMYATDLKHTREIILKNNMELNLNCVTNLPPQLDVSSCAAVDLGQCDLKPLSHLDFRDGAEVVLEYAEHLPENLDFSRCFLVNLIGCDLKNQSHLAFADGAEVYLDDAYNYCGDADFSNCSELTLDCFGTVNLKYVRFKNKQQLDDCGFEVPDNWNGKISFADDEKNQTLANILGSLLVAKNKPSR